MVDPKRVFFRHAKNEEPHTDFFISLLSWADTDRVLNTIHDAIEFDESVIVATQRDGLSQSAPENDTSRTLDWVVEDKTKLVGYEAKRGDGIKAKQLREERQKLKYNSDGKDVHLFVFTEDVHEPNVDVDVSWKSWFDVGAAVIGLDNKSKATEMMADMFENNGYDRFTGFTEYRQSEKWLITHQNEAVDFVIDAARHAKDLTLYDEGSRNVDLHRRIRRDVEQVKTKDHRSFGPSYYVFSILPEGYLETDTAVSIKKGWDIQAVIPALHNDVYVQLNIYLSKEKGFRELFEENAESLIEVIESNEMHVEASWNSLFHEETPTRYTDPDELREIFKNKGGEGRFKRLRIGWEVDTDQPSETVVKEAAKKMERLHEIFYDGIERRRKFESSID